MSSKGKQLKDLLRAPELLIAPGVFDGYSVRLVQQLGFKTASVSGAGVSESKLGWPDRGIMGYRENVEAGQWTKGGCHSGANRRLGSRRRMYSS